MVSGSVVQGQVLSGSSGSWSGTPPFSFAYQWLRCNSSGSGCVSVSGATGSSYTLVSADVGFDDAGAGDGVEWCWVCCGAVGGDWCGAGVFVEYVWDDVAGVVDGYGVGGFEGGVVVYGAAAGVGVEADGVCVGVGEVEWFAAGEGGVVRGFGWESGCVVGGVESGDGSGGEGVGLG